ncbi:uncharacterized protein LOC111086089 isoform X1 [Limulus polyphemus]|uniref:Uncharacterized protein LOC111086089 isoform X1 n=1 Tax=Limulus polyphemus TaxID=6850 RepID=A0ABM1SI63_LIMPO|nr:uncharacterized protein LOC111086089 isoform X1 [Limulus polyphemus]
MWKELITFTTSSHPMKTFILLLMIWEVTGFLDFDEDKRQVVIPYPRVGRSFWNWSEDKRQGLIPFPRIGRTSRNMTEDKQRVLVPFPQVDHSEEKDLQLALIPRQVIPSPRFGRSFTSGIGRHVLVWPDSLLVQQDGDKRSFFTPRISRILFIPRLDKTDSDSDSNILYTGY